MVRKGSAPPTAKDPAETRAAANGLAMSSATIFSSASRCAATGSLAVSSSATCWAVDGASPFAT